MKLSNITLWGVSQQLQQGDAEFEKPDTYYRDLHVKMYYTTIAFLSLITAIVGVFS